MKMKIKKKTEKKIKKIRINTTIICEFYNKFVSLYTNKKCPCCKIKSPHIK